MDVGGLFDTAGAQAQAEGALEGGAAHRFGGGRRPQAAVAFGREEQARMAVSAPELAQEFESALRQRHVTIAVAFAGPDVQEHALGVDVADFQFEGFTQAQAARVDGRQGDAMVQRLDPGQDAAHLGG